MDFSFLMAGQSSRSPVSETCPFCRGPVNPHDVGTWKKVTGWVHGPRKDSMTLREDTGDYAHDHCVAKEKAGQSVDQPDLFGEDETVASTDEAPSVSIEDLLEET